MQVDWDDPDPDWSNTGARRDKYAFIVVRFVLGFKAVVSLPVQPLVLSLPLCVNNEESLGLSALCHCRSQ